MAYRRSKSRTLKRGRVAKSRKNKKSTRKYRGGDISTKNFLVTLNLRFRPAIIDPENQQNIQTTRDSLRQKYPTSPNPIIDYVKDNFTAQRLIEDLMPLTPYNEDISNAQWINNFSIRFTIIVPEINQNTGQPFTAHDVKHELRTDSLEDGVYESVYTNGWTIKTMVFDNENLVEDDSGTEYGTVDYRHNTITVN